MLAENPMSTKPEIPGDASDGEDFFGPLEYLRSLWRPLLQWTGEDGHNFRLKADTSGNLIRILNSFPASGSSGGTTLFLTLEAFREEMVYDPVTKQMKAVRRQLSKRSPLGQPVLGLRHIAASAFLDTHEPAGTWMSQSEWRGVLESLKDVAAGEIKILADEKSAEDARGLAAEQQKLAQENALALLAEASRNITGKTKRA